jgi:hypothetical protein
VALGDAAKQLGHTLEMFYRTYSEWIEKFSGKSDLSRFKGTAPEQSPTKSGKTEWVENKKPLTSKS